MTLTQARVRDTPAPTHVWKSADGTRLAGDVWGDPDGMPVILLHSSGQTRHAWSTTARALAAAGFYAIAFDARGHGDSDWSPVCNYSQGAMVRDLECVAATLDGRTPALVGAGMGGSTSLLAVGERYVNAHALVLVNIAPQTESAAVTRLESFMRQQPGGFTALDEVDAALQGFRDHPARPVDVEGVIRSVRCGDDGKYHWHWDPGFAAWPRDLARRESRLSKCARNLDLPTLLVRGQSSEVVSEAGARAFLRLCPHAQHVNVRDAGHTIAGEHNDVFGDTVLHFLQRHANFACPPSHRATAYV
ncbi:alpha/beta fold hydrolase [Paraburkholderia silviterrae]|uniref:Alpha/beta hydrolase n=1 Tax=Paraburkholderia silviterrae TaxID=2528715 RepID=A0A4V2ZYN4_9BURK|nr:alpha/beta hydrolase [Paraburkholderia silviterrae]TDG21254.1 alpha/beta hydrolase [Paraburkholderia silviterrae]